MVGLWFLVGGLILLAVATKLAFMESTDAPPFWGWLIVVLAGATSGGVGALMVFGRQWLTLDLGRQCVLERWGLLVPRGKPRQHPLTGFDAVCLRVDAGDADTPDEFSVVLRARPGRTELHLLSSTCYQNAREAAFEIATFLKWPLVDSSMGRETVVDAADVAAPPRQRMLLGASANAPDLPVQPVRLRAEVCDSGHEVRVLIPPVGLRRIVASPCRWHPSRCARR